MPATVAECEINQTQWNLAVAVAGGGSVWVDGGLQWSWQAHNGQLTLNFPRAIDAPGAMRGVEFARERGAEVVGAWLSPETDATTLEAVGFERGWEPWWMAAQLDAIHELPLVSERHLERVVNRSVAGSAEHPGVMPARQRLPRALLCSGKGGGTGVCRRR